VSDPRARQTAHATNGKPADLVCSICKPLRAPTRISQLAGDLPIRTDIVYSFFIIKKLLIKNGTAIAVAGIICFSLMIAGCGGSSSAEGTGKGTYTVGGHTYTVQATTTATPTGISKAQFVTRADKFCHEAWVTILDNFAKYSSWQNPKWSRDKLFETSVHLSLLAGIDFHIFDNFYQLGAPANDAKEIEEMIGAMQLAVERGAHQHFSSVADVIAQFEEYNRRAQRYDPGLAPCLVNEAHLHKIEI
jgi:hypothetical protein